MVSSFVVFVDEPVVAPAGLAESSQPSSQPEIYKIGGTTVRATKRETLGEDHKEK